MKTSEKIENLTKTFKETDDLGEVVKTFNKGVKTGLYLARDIVIAEEKKEENNNG
mgnify:CR=1 FL=1